MSAGLVTSTVTRGSAAPDVSATSPAMAPVADCAQSVPGRHSSRIAIITSNGVLTRVIRKGSLGLSRHTPDFSAVQSPVVLIGVSAVAVVSVNLSTLLYVRLDSVPSHPLPASGWNSTRRRARLHVSSLRIAAAGLTWHIL